MLDLATIDLAASATVWPDLIIEPNGFGDLPAPSEFGSGSQDSPDIVVTGWLLRDYGGSSGSGGSGSGGSGGQYVDNDSADGGGTFVGYMAYYDPDTGLDEQAIEIEIDIPRPLTPSEQAAVDALNKAIEDIGRAIANLHDDARVRLPGGEVVTGKDIKEQWSKTDFQISDGKISTADVMPDTSNPLVRIDIGWLDKKDDIFGGINYTVMHELGHTIDASRKLYRNQREDGISDQETALHQRLANDFAKFLASFASLPLQQNIGFGYTDGNYTFLEYGE